MNEKLQLRINETAEVAFKWPDGKDLEGQYGPSVMFTTVDNKVIFLPPLAAAKIRALKLNPGERINLCKAEVNGAHGSKPHLEWQVQRVDPPAGLAQGGTLVIPKERAADSIATTHPEAAARIRETIKTEAASSPESAATVTTKSPNTADYTPSVPKTKLEDALRSVVHACHSARQYAKEIGYEMPVFNGDELVRMVNTLMINGSAPR